MNGLLNPKPDPIPPNPIPGQPMPPQPPQPPRPIPQPPYPGPPQPPPHQADAGRIKASDASPTRTNIVSFFMFIHPPTGQELTSGRDK